MDLQNSFTAANSSKIPTKLVLGYPSHLKVCCCITLENWKNHKFAILMHVKHVSNVTFHHLSNRCLPNVLKINVKINNMQNTNILLFRLFTVLNVLKECLIAVWSDFRQVIIDFAVDQWRKHLQACVRANSGHFEHRRCFVNKLLQTICIFHVLLVQVASIYRVSFLLCWWLIGLPCLTAKL